jgi:phage terminase large subunit
MTIQMPNKMRFLFEPHRYKILYGGRGGAKSWGVARWLLIEGASKPLRIFCGREIQKSIKNSVHKLLSDQIKALGLENFYTILQTEIRGKNGTEFIFDGLKHNIDNIKSLESADKAWIEEAQSVSKSSWDKLIPTIRKPGSEIIATFNPDLEDDETYQRFVAHPPTGSKVEKIGWQDNPWFPDVLKQEMEDLKVRSYDDYLHVWEGHCKATLEGAVYADEIRKATLDKRIGIVPHTSNKGVIAVFDLGHADATAIWFVQCVGHEFRLIDYYENQFKKIQHYMEYMQKLGYMFERIVLPHDAAYESLAADRTTEAIVRSSFPNATVTVLPSMKITEGIDAARTIFDQCWFDQNKCADGLSALRHYKYDKDPDTGKVSINPVHDWSSHGADAFRYLAVSIKHKKTEKEKKLPPKSQDWMAM